MIDQQKKKELINNYQRHTMDTGSPEVQISILSNRIAEISAHLATNKKDKASLRGLQLMVARRKKLGKYLQKKNPTKYRELIESLGIRG